MNDYLRGAPDDVAVLLAVELCSLGPSWTRPWPPWSRARCSVTERPRWSRSANSCRQIGPPGRRSRFAQPPLPRLARTMGWDIGASGFRIVLAPTCRPLSAVLSDDVTEFLAAHGLGVADIGAWVCHPGGPKILEAIAENPRPVR